LPDANSKQYVCLMPTARNILPAASSAQFIHLMQVMCKVFSGWKLQALYFPDAEQLATYSLAEATSVQYTFT
jgi:hypothetical protein